MMFISSILLQCKSDVDKQDFDGWTPMHAAAHWGQRDAATILADNLADMDMKNYVVCIFNLTTKLYSFLSFNFFKIFFYMLQAKLFMFRIQRNMQFEKKINFLARQTYMPR